MGGPKLVVVRRGHFATFELLTRTFANDPSVQIIWDRRTGERRQMTNGHGGSDRRRSDRRRAAPVEWGQMNYLIASQSVV